jgi:hypothetical protein
MDGADHLHVARFLEGTSVDMPGACEPRLNSLPLVFDMMLCGMLSSFTIGQRVTLLDGDALGRETRPC